MYIDLNKFKPINDKYGHEVGDAVLKVVSNRINGCIRFDDIAFRLGGDEFLILLNLTNALDKTELLNHIAEKIHWEVTRPIETEQTNIKVGLSAGCGIYPEDESDLMRLVNMVDKAMYSAKETGTHIANV
jgi:diguanylate cyclase (GGDEF)-like protein